MYQLNSLSLSFGWSAHHILKAYRFALLELVVGLPALVHQLHVASLVRVSRVHLLVLQSFS